MKIVNNITGALKRFDGLNIKECFEQRGKYYMKIFNPIRHNPQNAVSLDTGRLSLIHI